MYYVIEEIDDYYRRTHPEKSTDVFMFTREYWHDEMKAMPHYEPGRVDRTEFEDGVEYAVQYIEEYILGWNEYSAEEARRKLIIRKDKKND